MNRIILIGRLTRDVELRSTNSGKSVASFTVAVDRPFKSQNGDKETDFINIVAWGKLADLCDSFIGKGRLVAVSGRLQIRSYEDREGNKRYVTEVVADEVRFLDKPKEDVGGRNTVESDPATEANYPDGVPF